MMSPEDRSIIAKEIIKQLKEERLVVFDKTSDGLTQRDLIIEMRGDIKDLKSTVPNFVTKGQLATASATVAGIVLGVVRLFF